MRTDLVVIPEKVLYRYENTYEKITLYAFPIISETPKGVWVDIWGKKKFVLEGDDGKRYGYRTKEAALNSFRRRKIRHLSHLNSQLQNAQWAYNSVLGLIPQQVEEVEGFQNHKTARYFYED